MRRPTFKHAGRRPASTGAREMVHGKECNERAGHQESTSRIPMPMMLIIGALMGASID
jgi:hypothetical protein